MGCEVAYRATLLCVRQMRCAVDPEPLPLYPRHEIPKAGKCRDGYTTYGEDIVPVSILTLG